MALQCVFTGLPADDEVDMVSLRRLLASIIGEIDACVERTALLDAQCDEAPCTSFRSTVPTPLVCASCSRASGLSVCVPERRKKKLSFEVVGADCIVGTSFAAKRRRR